LQNSIYLSGQAKNPTKKSSILTPIVCQHHTERQIVIKKIHIIIVLFIININGIYSQNKPNMFIDSLDNALDLSHWLFNLHGILPIISPITEPAVGYGAVGVGLYFISKEKTDDKQFKMPDIIGAGVGYTQNGTWFGGVGYAGFWKDDKIRYRGVLGYGDINLKYYGLGGSYLEKNPANFSIGSLFFLQQAVFRIKNSNFLLGGKYLYGQTKVNAFEDSKLPWVKPKDFDIKNSGVELIAEYESFNNILSPTKGIRTHISYTQFLEALGGDRNTGRLTFFTVGYVPITKKWSSGLRVESMLASGNTPFYLMPFVILRGVPALRYQGELTMLAETEQFVNVYKRWSVVGFGGIGNTIPKIDKMDFGTTAWNAGGGFRYLIARLLGLQMGLDIARGPEDWAVYVVFGNAWLR